MEKNNNIKTKSSGQLRKQTANCRLMLYRDGAYITDKGIEIIEPKTIHRKKKTEIFPLKSMGGGYFYFVYKLK